MKFFANEKNELKIGKEKKRKRKERIYLNASLDSMSLIPEERVTGSAFPLPRKLSRCIKGR